MSRSSSEAQGNICKRSHQGQLRNPFTDPVSNILRIVILSYYLDGCPQFSLSPATLVVSKNLWDCIAPTLHIAINSDVNGLVLSIMDGIDTEWQAKRRTLGFSGTLQQIKRKIGSGSKKNMCPQLTVIS